MAKRMSVWRQGAVAILSVALINVGLPGTASAAIVDTGTLVNPAREADLAAIRAQLDRADVKAEMQKMGVDANAIDARLASLSDQELHQLAQDMENAPAGGILGLLGAVFVVLLVLELVGVIDIFKTVGPR